MKDALQERLRAVSNPIEGRNVVREYLQARILGGLQKAGAFVPLAFHGGTALRFLFSSPRYSEDLGFALERASESYEPRRYLLVVRRELEAEGYRVEVRLNDQRTVHSAFVRFPGLLHECGLSGHRDEVVAVKVEVDTRPPQGAGLATTVVRRHALLHLQHHDRPSLLAGKVHAVLSRSYLKGRDLYDLVWYLSDPDWPEPNLELLRNALAQTGWEGEPVEKTGWQLPVWRRIEGASWSGVLSDLSPFVDPAECATLVTPENLKRLLGERRRARAGAPTL